MVRIGFDTHSVDHMPEDWCDNGTRVAMTYEEQPNWSVYVSDSDREIITFHLMAMSGFLFAMAFVGVLTILLKGFGTNGKGGGSASTRKSVGDVRGDMELVGGMMPYEDY